MVAIRWARPEWHENTDSTQLLALQDPRPGRVVVARHQRAGQGRRGRVWTAPPGTALAVSAVVPAPPPPDLPWLPLVAGLAVARAVGEGAHAVPARLKWPNDLLLQDPADGQWRKACGVLAQVVPGRVVVGAGLNVRQRRAELPVPTALSWALARGAEELPRAEEVAWLGRYLDHLAAGLADLPAAREGYQGYCDTLGQQVRVELPGGAVREGTALGLGPDGSLRVRGSDGGVSIHHVGDVVHVRAAGRYPAGHD
ncbi:biotin--[acetyl-CoA-carboxylase] ligase [Ornithinicoccus halotolerans]|uniref:biotin--[acetyl-CoA-carboxylase] ligase n=1 Tax=Ornithinicoccus halotolerans TaxID=1748220 RepID=UPI0012958542|nr:biotin--[acetyl-CoA-carboxylase] ligase [Ornithinicoccus halotolerans]